MSPRIIDQYLNLPRSFILPRMSNTRRCRCCSLLQFDACPVSSSSKNVPSAASSTAHREDVSRLACQRSQAHSFRYFSPSLVPTTRSSPDRCRTLVAMRHNLRHMRASRRRASRGGSPDTVRCAGSYAFRPQYHGEKFEFRSIADDTPFVTRR